MFPMALVPNNFVKCRSAKIRVGHLLWQKCSSESILPHELSARHFNEKKIFWHEPCSLEVNGQIKESEVNEHEKTYFDVGSIINVERDYSIGLCST
jgi:hypothetical protein